MDLTRRELIKAGIACTLAVSPADVFARRFLSPGKNEKEIAQNDAPEKLWKWSKEVYYKVNLGRNVQCLTCPNQCILEPNARSRCQSHVNKDGKLYTLVYGNPCAVHVDPVEKKPLYHFFPSSGVLSIATTGCNFRCLNCQNWEISQERPEDVKFTDMFPDAVVENARKTGCRGIAYTYSEPTTFYEYMLDTSRLAREEGIKNIWVTNGYINKPPLIEFCKTLDAANIDIKSFSEDIYSRLNAGKLKPVLRTLMILKEKSVWFEITALIVPTYSDNMEMIKRMCGWILKNLGPDYPLHFSRFYPRYKLTHLPPTSIPFLEKARKTAMEMGIHYVYVGNVPQADSNHTYCPFCRKKIIERLGYLITENKIKDGKCSFCRQTIAGVWE
ncbi:MAG: AmmeMemoRadiSam system radical SAM enzyme [Proteobacteria bacterium]|nr:AmmeMemoRadiSam system radical SAM enzyme [Pseudomonadota bacterium]